MIAVAPAEPGGANALWMSGAVVYPTHYPETAERLDRAGLRVVPVPCTELAKAEGGVTCCSVLFEVDAPHRRS
jgi:dimethylargininase